MSISLLAGAAAAAVASAACQPARAGVQVAAAPGVSLHVRTVGSGRPVLYIPSLARGVGDFDDLAARLAKRGRMAILPDPRGIGGSSGPPPATLADLADDTAAVIAKLCPGPVDVVGHAFGNRVARMLAARHAERVARLVLLAGGGEVQMPPDVLAALNGSVAEGEKPDAERLKDIAKVFFARGNRASLWLHGWSPAAARQQSAATQATERAAWWTAGRAPILLIQASEDPIAPPANGASLKAQGGDRVTLLRLDHASHAILPEQPIAVAAVITAWLDGEADGAKLQALIDANVRVRIREVAR